jgi:hypothetical protein
MLVTCQGPGCQIQFEAARKTAKYHSDTCRQRARRHPDQIGQAAKAKQAKRRVRLQAATRAELAAIGKQETTAGIMAQYLAEEIDAGAESAAALAALSKEYAAAMNRATEDGPAEDPVSALRDEVRARKLRVMAGGGGAG